MSSKILLLDIDGLKKYYVSDQGHLYVRHSEGFKQRPVRLNMFGYPIAKIHGQNVRVHRLVAEMFIPNPHQLETVDHINGDKTDNRVVNLQWLSREDNVKKSLMREYTLVSPDGVVHTFVGMAEFCRANGLTQANVSKVIMGERPSHKGWTAYE